MPSLKFESTPHTFNWEIIHALPLVENGGKNITVGEVLKEALPHRFAWYKSDTSGKHEPPPFQECKLSDSTWNMEIVMPGRTIQLDHHHNASKWLLESIIKLDQLVGDQPFAPVFYYYSSDWVRDDPAHESHSFFVVNNERIVEEQFKLSFSRFDVSEFDVLKQVWDFEPIWANDRAEIESVTRWWYRKFYEDTRVGQFITLSELPLHYYLPQHRLNTAALQWAQKLSKQQRLTNALLGIACVALFLLLAA